MADKNVAVIENPATGEAQAQKLSGDVTKQTVDLAVRAIAPVLKEWGASFGESMKDSMEFSFEKVAKAIEEGRPVNQEEIQKRHNIAASSDHFVHGDELVDKQTAKQVLNAYVQAIGGGHRKGDLDQAKSWAASGIQNKRVAHHVEKALTASDFSSAGILVPDMIRDMIKELKDNAVVFFQMVGDSRVTIRGSQTLPKELTRATAYYQDEAEDLTVSDVSYGQDRIVLKKLTALMVASMELLIDGVNIEPMIQRQLRRAYRLKYDSTLIRGTGSAYQPTGLRYQIHPDHVQSAIKAGANATASEIHQNLVRAIANPKIDNHDVTNGTWLLNSTVWSGMWKRLTTDDHFPVFGAELLAGRLLGYRYLETNSIPSDLNGDESEVYFCLPDEISMFQGEEGVRVDASTDVSYKDGSGTLQSAWSRDEMAMKLIDRHEMHLEYPEAGSVITAVDWQNV